MNNQSLDLQLSAKEAQSEGSPTISTPPAQHTARSKQ